MVIKLKSRKKPVPTPPSNRFTIEDVENLFKQSKDWKQFYTENENKLWESRVDIYEWPVYPLSTKEDQFYRCILHPDIEVNCGPDKKPLTFFFRNIHYAEFISHCIYYRPEEHKQYIIEKLFGNRVSTE
jgi:hypothetical protein